MNKDHRRNRSHALLAWVLMVAMLLPSFHMNANAAVGDYRIYTDSPDDITSWSVYTDASTLEDAFNAINSSGTYTIAVTGDITEIAMATLNANGAKVYLVSADNGSLADDAYTITSNITYNSDPSEGRHIKVSNGTLILQNIILAGDNKSGGVSVTGNSSKLEMQSSATIENCVAYTGGGVHVASGGNMELGDDAIIQNCKATNTSSGGGAVYVSGSFTMNGGTIADNEATNGGGVFVFGSSASFTMNGGTIISNIANSSGGGVYAHSGDVAINGGTIEDNGAESYGGGIYSYEANDFTISDGTITENIASVGAGVAIRSSSFEMTGGSIYNNVASSRADDLYVYANNSGTIKLISVSDMTDEDAKNLNAWCEDKSSERYRLNDSPTKVDTLEYTGTTATLELAAGGIYNLSYDVNTAYGGVGTVPATKSYRINASITVANGDNLSNDNAYSFNDWNTKEDGSGSTYEADSDFVIPARDTTLYAQWKNPSDNNNNSGGTGSGTDVTTYSVYYYANGGTGSHTDSKLSYNSSYTILTQTATGIAYEGKYFAGWNTSADGTGTSYDAGYSHTIRSSLVLYAQWEEQPAGESFTVNYHANGGTGSYTDSGIAADTSYRVLSESSVGIFRDEYTFIGWNTSADGSGTSYSETNRITLNSDLDLYAQWSSNSSDGGSSGSKENTLITLEDDISPFATFSTDHFAYVIGYPDGYVRPENNILRSEVTTIFFRLLNASVRYDYWGTENDYSDVDIQAWYNNSISVMTKLGIISGYPNGNFGPQDYITRGELAAVAARFAKLNGTDAVTSLSFSDISGHWAEDYILYAANVGWINGYTDGSFRPDEYITRAELVAIVNRMLERAPESTDDLLAEMITWPDNADTSKWYYLDIQEASNSHYYETKVTMVPDRGYYYESWTALRDAPNWSVLEKPDSQPYDLTIKES